MRLHLPQIPVPDRLTKKTNRYEEYRDTGDSIVKLRARPRALSELYEGHSGAPIW